MRRLMVVRVSPEFLESWLTPNPVPLDSPRVPGAAAPFMAIRCETGLPGGAKCVGACWDSLRSEACLVFEHESFPEMRAGEEPATLNPPTFRTQAAGYCLWGHKCPECHKEI